MENGSTDDFLAEIGIGQVTDPGQGSGQQQEGPIDAPSFFGEEFTDWGKVKTEIPAKLQKLSQLEQENNELRNSSLQYSDPEIGEYDSFVKNTGKKDWSMFQKVKSTEQMEGMDSLVFKTIYENPELAGKEEQIRAKLVKDYKIDPDLYDTDDVEFAMNKKKMEQDAASANEWFKDIKGKVKVQSISPEQIQQQKAEKVGQWKTAIQDVVNQVTKIPIPIWDDAKKEIRSLGEFELKDEHRSAFIEPLSNAFANYELNDSNRQMASQEFTERFVFRNLPYIIDAAVKVKEAEIRSAIEAEYGGNVQRPNSPGNADRGGMNDFEAYLNS